jgi:hypothetical protein
MPRSRDAAGELVAWLGVPLLDERLEFFERDFVAVYSR